MNISINNSKQVMEAYMPLIRSNARKFSSFEYDETVDESRMILMEAIGKYDDSKGTFGNFLKLQLRYHYLDKAKKDMPVSLDAPDETGTPLVEGLFADVDIEKDVLVDEKYKDLHEAINRLDERDREIIRLKYWDELSNKEIGERLGISAKTVANRSSMALKLLKEDFENR